MYKSSSKIGIFGPFRLSCVFLYFVLAVRILRVYIVFTWIASRKSYLLRNAQKGKLVIYMELSGKKIERFLEWFANLKPGDDAGADRVLQVYRSHFPASFPAEVEEREREQDRLLEEDPTTADFCNREEGRTDSEIREAVHDRLWGLAIQLRRAWDEPNLGNKLWYTHELRRGFYLSTEPSRRGEIPLPPPSPTGFQQDMDYFLRNADRARHCMNPSCKFPYYFTAGRRHQRYCSSKCAGPAKREARLRWARKQRAKGKG